MGHGLRILSCGAHTAVGQRARATAAAMRVGLSGLQEHPFMVDRAGEPYVLGYDGALEATGRLDRLLALAHGAIGEALADIGQPLLRVPVFVAASEVPAAEAEPLARQVEAGLVELLAPLELDVVVLPGGNAAGFSALQAAAAEIETGREGLCIVAGADSFVDADVLDALDVEARLACPRHWWGFPPGEAGAAIVLASPQVQEGLDSRCKGQILSVAIGHETHHARAETPCTGEGLGAVLTEALQSSGAPGIALTLCDLDGERYRDREYAWATQRVPPSLPFDPTRYETLAPCCGAVGGASAILGLVAALGWAERGHCDESDILLWAGSELGLRGSAVLRTGPRLSRS